VAKILVVDDEEGIRAFLADALSSADHDVETAGTVDEAIATIAKTSFQVVLTDLKMPGENGIELVRHVTSEHPDVEIIVLTAHGTVTAAVEAMRLGAFDFLQKPLESPAELRLLVQRALERHRLRAAREASRPTTGQQLSWGAPAMDDVVKHVTKVANTQATVLLTGESGTGKEVLARALHAASKRAEGPFVAVNCAALAETLLESELFGHEKGAFTNATTRRRGRVELADGGTLFLDEVGELKLDLQAKLLRVLQEREFERVGGSQTVTVDVRWVAATNRDLAAMMNEGGFREDLYHRLSVFPIQVPPLRERREDIPPLADLLLTQVGAELGRPELRLGSDAHDRLARAQWRGNVRELRNTLERTAILADGPEIQAKDLVFVDSGQSAASGASAKVTTLEDAERAAIERALASNAGNRKNAAQELGIGVRTLYEKLKRYGLS
jgi:two-component system response regulator FlrC